VLERLLAIATVVVRQLGAYTVLLETDFAVARRVVIHQLWAGVILAAAAVLAALLLCVWVIAMTWDGPYRSSAIALLAAVWMVVATGAWMRLRACAQRAPVLMDLTARAWEQDRRVLHELIHRHVGNRGEEADRP